MLDASKHAALQKLISDTTDALTYQKWLQGKLEETCGGAGDAYRDILSRIENDLSARKIEKTQLIQGFYEELSDHHTFLEDYAKA